MEAGTAGRLSGSDAAAVQSEIERRLARHAEGLGTMDVDGCLELYTDDAVVRPANMDAVHGKEELRQFFTQWFGAMSIQDAVYTSEELEVYEDRAYQIGTYSGTSMPHEGEPMLDRGSFHIVWKREPDGSWRYYRGIFNSSVPVDETITSKGQQ